MYRRLMSVADDYGRFYGTPAAIRGACWPTAPEKVSEKEISKWIRECSNGEKPLITVYEVQGVRFIQLNAFGQRIQSKSKFPEPLPLNTVENCEELGNIGASRSRISETKSKSESYLNPLPESQNKPSASSGNGTWPEESRFVESFLKTQTLLKVSAAQQQALLSPDFWERTSEACGGIDLPLLTAEFAKMGNWIEDHPARAPTPRGIRRFVSGWLSRKYEKERLKRV